jgi:hypothetical protein
MVVSGKDDGDVAARLKTAGGSSGKDGGDVGARWKTSGWSSGKDGGDVGGRHLVGRRERMVTMLELGGRQLAWVA